MIFNAYTNSLNILSALKTGTIGNGFTWADALNVAICGIVIVFFMLVLLVLVIMIFGKIMDRSNKAEKTENNNVDSSVTSAPDVTVVTDEEDVVAAIAAAVDYLYRDKGVKPVIRSIKPSNSVRSPWATAGIIDNTKSF